MYIGIDVGGTFTDGVIVKGGKLIESVKVPTYPRVSRSVTEALKKIIREKDPAGVKRIVLSTTIITNLIAQGNLEPAGLILLPGPGARPESLKFAGPIRIIDGAVDYRGRILAGLDKEQLLNAARDFLGQGIRKIVVVCKFSQRNKSLEEEAVRLLAERLPEGEYLASSEVGGLLNWVRRANGALYTLTTKAAYYAFVEEIEKTLEELGLVCPVRILKADSGTLPLALSRQYPLEALYSGPAASVLGALAATSGDLTAVVVDIGGTTTDLALILKGAPLLSERGAFLQGCPVPVRALAVSSVPLGGDNSLEAKGQELSIGKRKGPALCLGGPALTVTDLLAYQGLSDLHVTGRVRASVEELAESLGIRGEELAPLMINKFTRSLEAKLEEMFTAWEEEPAYRIWQVLNKRTARPSLLICQGGPAKSLGAAWAAQKGWQVKVPPYAHVTNAIGAALAKDTLRLEYSADTQRQSYTTNIGGRQGRLPSGLNSLNEARSAARSMYAQIVGDWGLELAEEPELLYEESFNMVRGWSTTGKVLQVGIQTPPGLITGLAKEEADNE